MLKELTSKKLKPNKRCDEGGEQSLTVLHRLALNSAILSGVSGAGTQDLYELVRSSRTALF